MESPFGVVMSDALDVLLARVFDEANRARPPVSTYRLQFHAGFTFRDATRIVPYLHELGITHCYASPYLKARPGSTHGYDISDHRVLNPEIGSAEDYRGFVEALHAHGMGQILDIVPNHMGVLGNENPWWNDVLENGPASSHAKYFDIAWHSSPRPELREKILLPVLGDSYGKVLEAGQIRLTYGNGSFAFAYFEHVFPLAPHSYAEVLNYHRADLEAALGPESSDLLEYQSIITAIKNLPLRSETDPTKLAELQREKEIIKRRLGTLTAASGTLRGFIERTIESLNGTPGQPRSFDKLNDLLNDQPYRLSFWRVASDEINYRRFFDINELAALSMEREEVFAATHALVLRLLDDGSVDGLRIDHPDGLFDPREYLLRLQRAFLLQRVRRQFDADPAQRERPWDEVEKPLLERIDARLREVQRRRGAWPLYVVVEKILGAGEDLPEEWAAAGTSGYEFLNQINGLFVDTEAASLAARYYSEWTEDDREFDELVYDNKFLILRVALSSELHMLAYQLDRLAQKHRFSRDFTLNGLRHALRSIIAAFPVYRSYITAAGVSDGDRRHVLRALRLARQRNPAESQAIFDFARDMLLLRTPPSWSEEDRAEQLRFVGKFQQVTAPVMAKGLEDTTFYVYNRLTSLNEVGGDPGRFGLAPADLHRFLERRAQRWPASLSPLSTHDTKRGEDVRARINVLSEIPDEWDENLRRWSELNRPQRVLVEEGVFAPDANEESLIYQTLLGAWPNHAEDRGDLSQRMQQYLIKALHEAKVHSSWINPNEPYDEAVKMFVGRILDEKLSAPFLSSFHALWERVSHIGALNSLSQTLLRLTAPGVPDTYQGTELWNFSLVDPDNRRPVDYARHAALLDELKQLSADGPQAALARELLELKSDGRAKLWLTWKALTLRRDRPQLFAEGDYLPLNVTGSRSSHVFAFARRHGNELALVVAPRLMARQIAAPAELPLGMSFWRDTRLSLPSEIAVGSFRCVLTGGELLAENEISIGAILSHFSVGLLASHPY